LKAEDVEEDVEGGGCGGSCGGRSVGMKQCRVEDGRGRWQRMRTYWVRKMLRKRWRADAAEAVDGRCNAGSGGGRRIWLRWCRADDAEDAVESG